MIIENVHLTYKAKDQLIKLKRITGIQNWNILCRWGFCMSLADESPLPPVNLPNENAVEMTWRVFGGQHQEIFTALLIERCKKNGLPLDKSSITNQFRLHLHRGIGQLAEKMTNWKIEDLFGRCIQ